MVKDMNREEKEKVIKVTIQDMSREEREKAI